MTIRFACRCGKKMKTDDDKIGKKVLCSACGSPVVVPSSNTATVEKVVAPMATADTAGELLRGTATKQQTKPRKTIAHDDPLMDPSSAYDVAETARYFTRSFLLPAGVVLLFCALVYGVSNWISKTNAKHPELAEVSGVILLDGKPLVGARIIILPKTDDGSVVKASASVGRTDKDGHYRMEYTRDASGYPLYGVPLGPCAVQISATDSSGREVAPIRYRDRSETRVVESGSNTFEFKLESGQQ